MWCHFPSKADIAKWKKNLTYTASQNPGDFGGKNYFWTKLPADPHNYAVKFPLHAVISTLNTSLTTIHLGLMSVWFLFHESTYCLIIISPLTLWVQPLNSQLLIGGRMSVQNLVTVKTPHKCRFFLSSKSFHAMSRFPNWSYFVTQVHETPSRMFFGSEWTALAPKIK